MTDSAHAGTGNILTATGVYQTALSCGIPVDPVILQTVLLCLVAGQKHLILRTTEDDIGLAAKLVVLVSERLNFLSHPTAPPPAVSYRRLGAEILFHVYTSEFIVAQLSLTSLTDFIDHLWAPDASISYTCPSKQRSKAPVQAESRSSRFSKNNTATIFIDVYGGGRKAVISAPEN